MQFKKLLITTLLLAPLSLLMAQTTLPIIVQPQSKVVADTVRVPDGVAYALDHMLSNWLVSKALKTPCDSIGIIPPQVSDSVMSRRLSLMPCVMEMPFNPQVRSFISMYTEKRRKQVGYLMGLGDYYFKLFEEVLAKHQLPLELKYLPVIESALNARAISHMGAAGLWQFMVGTGKMYGLEVNSLVDERMDPIKSTHAAVKYLKDMYAIYGDWHLVIAAYNCGPGNVNKAIRRAGGKRDYWSIYPHLPRETRGYVPIFIAANYAMYYAPAYNICKSPIDFTKQVDTVMIGRRMHFDQIAAVLDIPKEQLRLMNPQYKRDIIPGDLKPYAVALPVNMTGKFIDRFEDILAWKADSLINNRRTEVAVAGAQRSVGSGAVILHKVKSGQTLGGIAARYGVSVSKIRQWNGISGTMIRVGQTLKIHK